MNPYNKNYFECSKFNRGKIEVVYDFAYSNLIKKILLKNSNVLELGCSYGNLIKNLEDDYYTIGIDISEYAINHSKKILKKSKVYVMDFEKEDLPIKNMKFNAILGIDIFEHFRNPNKVFKKCYKLLSNNGIIIIKIPNKSSIIFKILKLIGKEDYWNCYQDKTHYSILELKEWIKLLENNKFKVKVIASPPTNFLKNLFKDKPSLFFFKFNPKMLNETITIIGIKNK